MKAAPQRCSGPAAPHRHIPEPAQVHYAEDDDLAAALLIRMWALASGRALPAGVRPDQLSEEQLIAFWADDMSTPAGRHALAAQAGTDQ